jgi:hypothetical protein
MGVVEEESDETLYWIELLVRAALVRETLVCSLITECQEILSTVVASIKTVKKRLGVARRNTEM